MAGKGEQREQASNQEPPLEETQDRAATAGREESEHFTNVTISGPGAADFIAASGGLDRPETSATKGMAQTRDEGLLRDGRRLEPQLEPSDSDPETGAPPRDPLNRI
jgi:hypothetical protein